MPRTKEKRKISILLFSFLVVGGAATAAHYTTLTILVEFCNFTPVYASMLGYLIGMIVSYVFNYRFTFQSKNSHTNTITKFTVVAFFGFFLNSTIMFFGVYWLELHYILSQSISTFLTIAWNFAANLIWTFRERENAER